MWRTVRFRTTVAATIASAAVLVVVSTVTVWLLRAQLTDNLDEGLIGRADEIAVLLAANPAPELPDNEDVLIQVLAPDGTVRQASASAQGMAPITSAHDGVRTVDDVPGRPERFRVVARTVDTPRGPQRCSSASTTTTCPIRCGSCHECSPERCRWSWPSRRPHVVADRTDVAPRRADAA